ncbi:MAG: transcription elongation factor GreA [Chlamydiota bacterium]
MSYLNDFQKDIENHDFPSLKTLWEEYCTCDEVDPIELKNILTAIKKSSLAEPFGKIVEWIIPLWKLVDDEKLSLKIIKLIYDLETTNSPELAQLALKILKEKYLNHEFFNEKIRLIGLRKKSNFQGAITNYELLTHMNKGKFVYHTGGWGVGEIVELSLVREQLVIEFENILGRKDLSFENAFTYLVPLPSDHFLARRFGDPDQLEDEARKDPIKVLHILLRDLGPKTASEIKDELCELVIPQSDWTKWWQSARAKAKKDTLIETPQSLKDPFFLRSAELSHQDRLIKLLEEESDISKICHTIHTFNRDFPEALADERASKSVKEILVKYLALDNLTIAEKIQLLLLYTDLFPATEPLQETVDIILNLDNVSTVINDLEITALKKRLLTIIRENTPEWQDIFIDIIFKVQLSQLKDYIFRELYQAGHYQALDKKLQALLENPIDHPRSYIWYFQKLIKDQEIPYGDEDGRRMFLENTLLLLNHVEQIPEYRDLAKKIYSLLTDKRFLIVRTIIEGASVAYLQEFLLLVTKCISLSNHDKKIMHSLAEVANPEIISIKKKEAPSKTERQAEILWTTQEGFNKTKERLEQISTVETVENAQEIEAARALGDLRENAEYKFALEKRARLQAELGTLSQQLNKARIITPDDISTKVIGIGNIVTLESDQGDKQTYTILGPWEADVEQNILSYQSRLAQTMIDKKLGDKVSFQDKLYKIVDIKSYLA